MTRALLIKLHLYLSAFFSAAIILVAVSGGLYLIGIKGSVEQAPVNILDGGSALMADPSRDAVSQALNRAGVTGFEFEYVKQKGAQLITRPTTRPFYTLDIREDEMIVQYNEPSFQKRMIELHMGHGPTAYKRYQQVFAAGMLFIMLSGLWLGLSSARLRMSTALISGSGLIAFLFLALA